MCTLQTLADRINSMFVLTEADNEHVAFPVAESDEVGRARVRRNIEALEDGLRRAKNVGFPARCEGEDGLFHHFIDGVYARELFIPVGTLLTGKLHRFPRICIIAAGEVSFATEFGLQRVTAPYTAVVPAGSKTAVFTHTDTTWIAVHGTRETDLARIEDELIAPDHETMRLERHQ